MTFARHVVMICWHHLRLQVPSTPTLPLVAVAVAAPPRHPPPYPHRRLDPLSRRRPPRRRRRRFRRRRRRRLVVVVVVVLVVVVLLPVVGGIKCDRCPNRGDGSANGDSCARHDKADGRGQCERRGGQGRKVGLCLC